MSLFRRFLFIIIVVAIGFLLYGCDDDDAPAAAYQLNLVDFKTDSNGDAKTMITDDGHHFSVINPLSGLHADTTYRYVTYYVEETSGTVRLASANPVICAAPREFEDDKVHTSPVTLVAIWRGSHYVNLALDILHKNKTHALGFIDHGIKTSLSGNCTLEVELYHDGSDDTQAFTSRVYVSCDLAPYLDKLTDGKDSVRFIINEYEKGKNHHTLPF